jgi:hypothetical protein
MVLALSRFPNGDAIYRNGGEGGGVTFSIQYTIGNGSPSLFHSQWERDSISEKERSTLYRLIDLGKDMVS